MALDEPNSGIPATMLVGPTGYGNNGGLFGNGDLSWLILLLLCGWGGGFGMGGFGMGGMMWPMMMGGMGGWGMDYLYPWLNNSQNINDGFRDQMLNTSVASIGDKITSGFGDVATQLCGGFAGVNQNICQTGNGITAAVTGAQNAIAQQLYANEIGNLNRSFAAQQQAADCCCKTQTGIQDLKYVVATENCADRAAISDGIRDLLAATQAQTQTILTQLCNDKLEQKNDTIAQLRSELLYARGQASQDVQTAAIQAGQRALANEVEQYVAPRAIPAYYVQNPNCCSQNIGCGCGCGA